MKKGNVVMWSMLAGTTVLFAVLTLVAQNETPATVAPPAKEGEEAVVAAPPVAGEEVRASDGESRVPQESIPTNDSVTGTTAPKLDEAKVLAAAEGAPATGQKPPVKAIDVSAVLKDSTTEDGDTAVLTVDEKAPANNIVNAEEMFDEATSNTNRQSSDRISVALDDVPLLDVVRMFTRISGANIIATATNLRGNVTVNISEVEWRPALESILSMHNMTLTETTPASGIYTIGPKEVGKADPLVVTTRVLKFASASNVVALITPLLDTATKENITPFHSRNTVVVRATAAKILDVEKVIKSVDMPRQQVYIEAKFVELSDSASKSLGVDWQSLDGFSSKPFSMNLQNLAWGRSETRDTVKSQKTSLLQTEDKTKSEVSRQNYDVYGLLTAEGQAGQSEGSGSYNSDGTTRKTSASSDASTLKTTTIKDIRTAVLNVEDFKVVISALEKTDGASIVSNPKIIVANEEVATIQIGKQEPNIKGTVTPGQQGQANTTTYSLDEKQPYFSYGVTVDVQPTINDMSNITVRISPTLSRWSSDKTAPDGNTYPVTFTKTIKTIFSLESGKTAAIGGLTELNENNITKKVPLLGDIPLIGKYLFQYQKKSKERTETIIFVTVGLANPEAITDKVGLPDDADLVHTHLLKKTYTKKESEKKLQEVKIALEKEWEAKEKKGNKKTTKKDGDNAK